MASSSVARTVRRKAPLKTVRQPGTLWGFDFRRPFDALWRLFGSVRLAIVLISCLVALSVVGIFISQAPTEVVSSPLDYAAWVAANAQPQYHQFTNLMDWLQFFTIFRSWYFKILIVLLALNILVGGMLNRAPGIWQKFRHPQLKRNEGFYRNSPVKVGLTVGDDDAPTMTTVTGLTAFFRKRGYRVAAAPESDDATAYLYVHKHSWTSLSTFAFHTALIGIMFSAVVTSWGGFGANSMAQSILPAPVYHYFQGLAGFSYDQPLPNGDQGVVYPLGTPHNLVYRALQFTMKVDPQRQQPTDFYTDMQVYQDGKLVAQKRIRVNDPLTFQGVTFHQASFMMYTNIQLRDAQGDVIYSGSIPLTDHSTSPPDPNTGNVLQTNSINDVPIPNYNETMNLAAARASDGSWLVGIRGFDVNDNPIFQGAAMFGVGCVSTDNTRLVAPGQYGCTLSNGWFLQVNDVRLGTVLLITKDAGSPLLWPILALLVLSVWITFSYPPRRLWVRVEGSQVRMAALKEHKVNLQRDLEGFARQLGNRPLHPEPPPNPASPTPKKKAKEKEKQAALV
jgi:cytochrome c biogenesis protein